MGAKWPGGRLVEQDVELADSRVLRVYDTHPDNGDRAVVVWHHGTPNVGLPPTPLASTCDRLGMRVVSFDRPGYGGSTPRPDRTVGDVGDDVARVLDILGVGEVYTMGHSGGGPHALACAALLADRVLAAVAVAAPAPASAEGFDWFAGMAPAGVATNRAASQGREALERFSDDHDADFGFTTEDEEALNGRWAWFLDVVRPATGSIGEIDDLLAAVRPWGFDPGTIGSPVLLLHGDADRVVPVSHGRWLSTRTPGADLVERAGDGHITVMDGAQDTLAWMLRHSRRDKP